MKIGIIGDLHFGASYNLGKIDLKTQLNSRLLDFSNTFDTIIDRFLKNNVVCLVLTGDIFETRHPTSAQLNMFSKCIRRAVDKGLEIVMVVGNHDQQRTISTTTLDVFGSLEMPKVSVYSDFAVHTIKDTNNKNINIILMPYRDRRMIGTKTNKEAIDIIKKKLHDIHVNLDGVKIVVGHFMIDRAITGENPDSFSMNELILPLNIFDKLDAVCMGHVHRHSILKASSPIIIYSGSMEKVSIGEKNHNKVTIVFDTNNINNPKILPTNTRDIYEMSFDYTEGDKFFKQKITDKIISDIDEFDTQHKLDGSIVKLVAKIKENDSYYVNQKKIKEFILSKNVNNIPNIQISSTNCRKLRNKDINENVSGKEAMLSFIKELSEPEQIKNKLIKFAKKVIEEVEGK